MVCALHAGRGVALLAIGGLKSLWERGVVRRARMERRDHLALIHFSLEKTCFAVRPDAKVSSREPERNSRLRSPWGMSAGCFQLIFSDVFLERPFRGS